jgi:hypothetical protein
LRRNGRGQYFEYPSTVAILLREIRYGIELSFAHVTVKPMQATPGPFSYHVGDVNVDYKPTGTSIISVPPLVGGGGPGGGIVTTGSTAMQGREFRLHGMAANASYSVVADAECDVARSVSRQGQGAVELSTNLPSVLTAADGVLRFRAHAHCGVEVTFLRQESP